MSDPSPESKPYLDRIFDPSTFTDIEKVLAVRSQWRGQVLGGPETDSPLTSPKDEIATAGEQENQATLAHWQSTLASIEQAFWETEPAEVLDRLQAIPTDRFPALRGPVQRRLGIAKRLPALRAAAQDPELDDQLWQAFESLLLEPRQTRAESQRRWLRRMRKASPRRQGVAFAKHLRKHHPEVFALEAEWLQETMRAKRIAADSKKPLGFLGCLGAYLLFKGILALVGYFMES